MIVLDTNVTSELMRTAPAPEVEKWVRNHAASSLFTSSITLAEIDYGIRRLPPGARRDRIRSAAEQLFTDFAASVLPFDAAAAMLYGEIVAERDRLGAPISALDAQIAAICKLHDASVATRNVRDFADTGVTVIDPWQNGSRS